MSDRLAVSGPRHSPDRKGEHPRAHLKDCRGVIHADGYAGFKELFAGGDIVEAGCWAYVRRKFFDVHSAIGSPVATEALDRIGQLYGVEATIKGLRPDHRRRERRQRSQPVAAALAAWADEKAHVPMKRRPRRREYRPSKPGHVRTGAVCRSLSPVIQHPTGVVMDGRAAHFTERPTERLGDWVVASALLALTLPLMVVVAIAIK
jgi:hypothetical protein